MVLTVKIPAFEQLTGIEDTGAQGNVAGARSPFLKVAVTETPPLPEDLTTLSLEELMDIPITAHADITPLGDSLPMPTRLPVDLTELSLEQLLEIPVTAPDIQDTRQTEAPAALAETDLVTGDPDELNTTTVSDETTTVSDETLPADQDDGSSDGSTVIETELDTGSLADDGETTLMGNGQGGLNGNAPSDENATSDSNGNKFGNSGKNDGNDSATESSVVMAEEETSTVTDLNINGTNGDDTLVGGAGNDNIKGKGGDDTLYGGAGDDTLKGQNGDDFLDGQSGSDTLSGGNGMDILVWDSLDISINGGNDTDTLRVDSGDADLTAFGGTLSGIEQLDLATDSGANSLTLDAQDVLDMSDTDIVTILGDGADSVDAGAGWTDGGIVGSDHVYTQMVGIDLATLLIDTNISVNGDILS